MHTKIIAGLFMLCAAAALPSAQTPTPPIAPPESPSATAPRMAMPQDSQSTMTYQGCIQRGLAATSATPGATGTSGSGSFVLANAARTSSSASGSPSAGPSTTRPSASASPASAVSYRLEGDEAKLAPHVGKRVEITGMFDDHAASPANADTTSGNIGRTSGNTASVKVDSIKEIPGTCPAE